MPTFPHAQITVARFGSTYGYRFNGDNVELHATFQLLGETAHQLQWALQLRAVPVAAPASPLTTFLIAEASLPPLAEIAGMNEPFFLTTSATPPAGSGEFNLHLVLVAKSPIGPDQTHDVAFFDHPERFAQPRFTGEVSHQLVGEIIQLNIASLENPRDPANVSGTLSLELWALADTYTGGTFQGSPLSSVIIGHLAGQQNWHNLAYNLTINPAAPGRWHLALMLREWTGNGFTTRDYFNFALPFEVEAPLPVTPEPIVQVVATAPKVEPPAPAKSASPIKTVKAPTAKKVVAPKKSAKPTKTSKAAPTATPARPTPPPAAKRTSR